MTSRTRAERISNVVTGAEATFEYLPPIPFDEPMPEGRLNKADVVRVRLVSPDGDEASEDIPFEMWQRLVRRLNRAMEAGRANS